MNSSEVREALKDAKFEGLEVEWDDRRKSLTVGGPKYFEMVSELEALGFECNSPMFGQQDFKDERQPVPSLKEKYEAMTPEEKKRADDQFNKMATS